MARENKGLKRDPWYTEGFSQGETGRRQIGGAHKRPQPPTAMAPKPPETDVLPHALSLASPIYGGPTITRYSLLYIRPHGDVTIATVWFEAYRRLFAVMGVDKWTPTRFAPTKAGARAHASRQIASVLQQNGAMNVGGYPRLSGEYQLQLHLYNHCDQRERAFTNRTASANYKKSAAHTNGALWSMFDKRSNATRNRLRNCYDLLYFLNVGPFGSKVVGNGDVWIAERSNFYLIHY